MSADLRDGESITTRNSRGRCRELCEFPARKSQPRIPVPRWIRKRLVAQERNCSGPNTSRILYSRRFDFLGVIDTCHVETFKSRRQRNWFICSTDALVWTSNGRLKNVYRKRRNDPAAAVQTKKKNKKQLKTLYRRNVNYPTFYQKRTDNNKR